MMKKLMIFFVVIMLISPVIAYNSIEEFDENEDIILTTVVYNSTGLRCLVCDCNLTVYNPSPSESIINVSVQMDNNGNGIFTKNVSSVTKLSYNRNIYPLTLVCNDSNGYFGGDDREGIKVNKTVFDYTAGILALLGVALGLLFASFKIDPQFEHIRRLVFFSSFAFFFATIGLGYFIMKSSPNSTPYEIILEGSAIAFLMIIFAVIFLYFKARLVKTVETIGKGRIEEEKFR